MDPDQKFIAFVYKWAKQHKCTFVIDDFDGHESPDLIDWMAVDDVWGWLLPEGVTEKDDDYFGCAEWSIDRGKLELSWNSYDQF